jgi:RNA polymerase sigma factor (sigma-70 family)
MVAAQKLASIYLRNVPPYADCDGVRGAAYLGLCRAAAAFNPSLSLNFEAYAARRIGGEMQDFCRAQSMLTPHRSLKTTHPARQEMPGQISDRRRDPHREAECRDEVRHMLRRLHGRTERMVMNAVASGVAWDDIARAVGVSKNMIFQIRARAMKRIKAA